LIEKSGAEHSNLKNIQLKKIERAVEEVKKNDGKKEVVVEKGSDVSSLRNIFDAAARQKSAQENLKKAEQVLNKSKSLAKEADQQLE
jgi:hypothetical protein